MTGYDLYIFILCAIVFTILTGLLTYLITTMVKMQSTLIRVGQMDSEIVKECSEKKKKACLIDCIVSILLCGLLLVCFGFSLYVNFQEERTFENIPTISVVKSNSMSKKNEINKYLFDNNLDNQFDRFDLILTYKKPAEEDLKLYDIVIYQQDDIMVVHRIIAIEEPNDSHPYNRHFLCQGDANDTPDKFPVLYSQIKGIYKGEKIAFVGSFVLFMQSPAGWLCILLTLFAVIVSPIVEKKLKTEYETRLQIINMQDDDEDDSTINKEPDVVAQAGGHKDV